MTAQVSAVSWFDSGGPHLRIYTVNGASINEQCWDGNGPWYAGGYRGEGNTVGAVSWTDSARQIHIRVYSAANGVVSELCWDKDHWYKGAMTASGASASATAWVDGGGQVHIRTYVTGADNKVTEYCWDKDKWYVGAYRGATS